MMGPNTESLIDLKAFRQRHTKFNKLFLLINFLIIVLIGYLAWRISLVSAPLLKMDIVGIFMLAAASILLCTCQAYWIRKAADESQTKIADLVFTDPLTGVYNYRYLERRLLEELSRSKRYDCPLSILYVDIDDFKKVNDEHGHQIGDEVLVQVARLLKTAVRQSDLLGRMGGDEFLIILPETDMEAGRTVGKNLVRSMESHNFNRPGIPEISFLGLSVGIASYPRDGKCDRDLINAADNAMYRAKRDGGHRVGLCQTA